MTKHLPSPPAHVWDRIEKILDEQEYENKFEDKFVADSGVKSTFAKGKVFLTAVFTGASLLVLLSLKYFAVLKNN